MFDHKNKILLLYFVPLIKYNTYRIRDQDLFAYFATDIVAMKEIHCHIFQVHYFVSDTFCSLFQFNMGT